MLAALLLSLAGLTLTPDVTTVQAVRALPIADANGRTVRIDDTKDDAPLPPGGPVVLVVDDDDAVRAFACLVLQGAGLTVLAAANADAALALLAAHAGPVDVLLTDLTMPGMSGTELAARVRAERPGVRVLFASGDVPDSDDPHFLSKPFTAAQLADRVGGVLVQPVEVPFEGIGGAVDSHTGR